MLLVPLFRSLSDHTPAAQVGSQRKQRKKTKYRVSCSGEVSVSKLKLFRGRIHVNGKEGPGATQVQTFQACQFSSTFLWIVLRRVVSSQALVQYVKHLSTEVNENQGESSNGHPSKIKRGLGIQDKGEAEVGFRNRWAPCRWALRLSFQRHYLIVPVVNCHW